MTLTLLLTAALIFTVGAFFPARLHRIAAVFSTMVLLILATFSYRSFGL